MQTIAEARSWLRKHWDKGAPCPCCTQEVRMYRRKIYGTQAAALINFYRKFDHNSYHHKSELASKRDSAPTFFGSGEFAKLSLWGLIEEKIKDDSSDKRTSGYWKITQKGIDFVHGKLSVPKYIRTFNSHTYGSVGENVYIQDCLGEKFSYQDLMEGK